ncbi:MAG: hypothetical protein KAS32_07085 [Candidatus Peribacteraceae bacterium]|nr:hypothetical protein [Candidatus Peribacteraceae bacterium]
MDIKALSEVDGSTITTDELLSYLSQIVLSKTESEIGAKEKNLRESQKVISQSKAQLQDKTDMLTRLTLESKRAKTLYRVLATINTLKKEGVLVGNNRTKISKILPTIQDQSFQNLRAIEEKLQVYLPDNFNRVSIS